MHLLSGPYTHKHHSKQFDSMAILCFSFLRCQRIKAKDMSANGHFLGSKLQMPRVRCRMVTTREYLAANDVLVRWCVYDPQTETTVILHKRQFWMRETCHHFRIFCPTLPYVWFCIWRRDLWINFNIHVYNKGEKIW